MIPTSPSSSLLLYGLCLARPGSDIASCSAVAASDLFCITEGGVAALVSLLTELSSIETLPARKLLAFAKVIDSVHQRQTILPFRFGSVFPDRAALEEYLRTHHQVARALIESLDGKEELAIRITLPRSVLKEAVSDAQSIAGTGKGAAYLRQRRQQLAAAEQLTQTAQNATVLVQESLGESIRLSDAVPRVVDQQVVISLAALMARGCHGAMKSQLQSLAMKSAWSLHISGPFPPYSFVGPLAQAK